MLNDRRLTIEGIIKHVLVSFRYFKEISKDHLDLENVALQVVSTTYSHYLVVCEFPGKI